MNRIIFILMALCFFNVDIDAQSWKKYLNKKAELVKTYKITKRGLYFEIGIPDINSQY